jgi:hypothetical protein
VHVPRRFRRQVTNTFLFARDRYRCQYCGRAQAELKPRESLTRDHVIPMSRGGTNEWANVVTACSPCNLRKADHYPHEIGMHPMTVPAEPHFVHLSWAVGGSRPRRPSTSASSTATTRCSSWPCSRAAPRRPAAALPLVTVDPGTVPLAG